MDPERFAHLIQLVAALTAALVARFLLHAPARRPTRRRRGPIRQP